MKSAALWVCAFVLLTGCARSTSYTEIRKDGTWQRKLTLVLGSQTGMSDKEPKIEDVFVVPKGAGWKTESKKENDEIVFTASREMKLGELIEGDLSIIDEGKVSLVNEVQVKEADGRFIYRETFRWKGTKPKEIDKPMPELMKTLNEALPATATKEDKEFLAVKLQAEIWRVLMGPGDPILFSLLLQPDYAERKLRQRLGKAVINLLIQRLGDRLTDDQRREAGRKLMSLDKIKEVFDPKEKAESEQKSDKQSYLVTMAMIVKMPGEIISSNGEVDPLTNEVYWAMLPEAAAIGEVTLEAISKKE